MRRKGCGCPAGAGVRPDPGAGRPGPARIWSTTGSAAGSAAGTVSEDAADEVLHLPDRILAGVEDVPRDAVDPVAPRRRAVLRMRTHRERLGVCAGVRRQRAGPDLLAEHGGLLGAADLGARRERVPVRAGAQVVLGAAAAAAVRGLVGGGVHADRPDVGAAELVVPRVRVPVVAARGHVFDRAPPLPPPLRPPDRARRSTAVAQRRGRPAAAPEFYRPPLHVARPAAPP